MATEVIKPPEIVNTETPVLFLAGPIQGAEDWQEKAIDIISGITSGITIASPRREYPEGTFVYEKQVDWETEYLKRAAKTGAVMFWLACQAEAGDPDERGFSRAYAQTSRFELAEAKLKHERDGINLVVGIEKGFGNERYIRRRFSQDCPNVPILDRLDSTCRAAVKLIKEQ
ncbi:MAG: nucleoside 2-deoxyribosyltransferase domain-containing protein [Candidatus Saccharimonadales bacterium]